MKKFGGNDIKVLVIIGILCLVFLGGYFLYPKKTASKVNILVDGKSVGIYDLTKNQRVPIEVKGQVTNTLEIADGQAFMEEADCPDHLCMKQGKISYQGETIVCLPNKVVVQVESKQESQFDSVAK